jgi:hypothetical protein
MSAGIDIGMLVDLHLDSIKDLGDEAARIHAELATLTAERYRTEADIWFNSQETTVSGRDHHAQFQTYATDLPNSLGLQILTRQARLKAIENELRYHELCLTHGR